MSDELKQAVFHSSLITHHSSLPSFAFRVARADSADVVARLAEGWHAIAEARDVALARVVAGQHQINAPSEFSEQLFEVARAGGDALRGVVRVAHAEARGSARHQLHQPHRARRADGARVEVRLLFHHAEDQVRVNAVARAVLPYERVQPRAAR